MLKEVRLLKKMTQKELSEKSGVSIRMIQHYEQGVKDIKKAAAETVSKLAEVLGCDTDDIINEDAELEKTVKLEDALSKTNIHKGSSTVSAVLEQIPSDLIDRLSSDDIAIIIDIVDKAYKKGRSSTGAEMIDNETVWINHLQKEIKITQ
jgi:transcriptional regulator with XRE-family HTH domain